MTKVMELASQIIFDNSRTFRSLFMVSKVMVMAMVTITTVCGSIVFSSKHAVVLKVIFSSML